MFKLMSKNILRLYHALNKEVLKLKSVEFYYISYYQYYYTNIY